MSAPQYYEQQAPTDGSRGYPPNGYNNFNTNNRYPAYNSSGQYSAACPADIHSPIILYTFLIGLFESQTIASAIVRLPSATTANPC